MIYTVTFNPSLDYVMRTEGLERGRVNRSRGEELFIGGKGINVSAVLKELGVKSKAFGFVAGRTGAVIEDIAAEMGLDTDFIRLDSGNSRINVKIRVEDEQGSTSEVPSEAPSEATELNGRGPDINDSALDALFGKLSALSAGDTLVLAGSVSGSISGISPSDIYERIASGVSGRGVRLVVDAAKDLLLGVLRYEPFLIKPNHHELSEIFGAKITTKDEAAMYARKLKEMGAKNVLVSMAGDGAVLIDEHDKLHTCGACRGTVKNTVGAGDSMVAGFLAGAEGGDYEHALKLGTAAGGASAFSDGLAKRADIERLLNMFSAK